MTVDFSEVMDVDLDERQEALEEARAAEEAEAAEQESAEDYGYFEDPWEGWVEEYPW